MTGRAETASSPGPRACRVETLSLPAGAGRAAVRASRLAPPGGAVEWHLVVAAPEGEAPGPGLARVEEAYARAREELGLGPGTAVVRRVFLSRSEGLAVAVRRSSLAPRPSDPVALSLVVQPPLPDRPVALWAYHLCDGGPLERAELEGGTAVRRGGSTHLWLTDLRAPTAAPVPEQTRALLEACVARLAGAGATLRDHALRTWFYVADVDRDYAAMVRARREVFEAEGLTEATHFLASTGIGGGREEAAALVGLDLYAAAGLDPGQVAFLHAPDRLGSPAAYGPTFERGVRVDHGDRRHLLVSGTASIDPAGRVVHEGDPEAQLDRALGNVEALLADGGAGLSDLALLLVYVRRAEDHRAVEAQVARRCPGTPSLVLHAPVCRPAWLVEVEPWAALARPDPRWPRL